LTNKFKRHYHISINKDKPKEKQLVFEIGRGFERRHGVAASSALITTQQLTFVSKS
jgi:hypothetical protein